MSLEANLRRIVDERDEIEVYDDVYRVIMDTGEDYAKREDNINAMNAAHEAILTRNFARSLIYEELKTNVQERLRNFHTEIETDESETSVTANDKPPATVLIAIRILDKFNLKDYFNIDYGYVKQGEFMTAMGKEFESRTEGELSESAQHISRLTIRLMQEEYETLDQEYTEEALDFVIDTIQEIEHSNAPFQTLESRLREHKLRLHREFYKWPRGGE